MRGQIKSYSNKSKHHENTCFSGPHFAECYIVKGGECVVRDRIDVPVKTD
ncbi:hypothetical protein [Adlercreutzia sp. ZJ473]